MIKIPKNAMKQKVDVTYHIGEAERKMHVFPILTNEMRLKYLQSYMNVMFADGTYRADLWRVAHRFALISTVTDIDVNDATLDNVIYLTEYTDIVSKIHEVVSEEEISALTIGANKTEEFYLEQTKSNPARKLDSLLGVLTDKIGAFLDKLNDEDIDQSKALEAVEQFKSLLESERGSELLKIANGK